MHDLMNKSSVDSVCVNAPLWQEHIDSANLIEATASQKCGHFSERAWNSVCTPHHLFAWEANNDLPKEASMEIVDVCPLSLSNT